MYGYQTYLSFPVLLIILVLGTCVSGCYGFTNYQYINYGWKCLAQYMKHCWSGSLKHVLLDITAYILSVILSLEQFISGDVRIDDDGILQIYFTINASTGTKA